MRRHFVADNPDSFQLHDHVAWYGDGGPALDRLAVEVFRSGATRGEKMMFVTEDPDPRHLRDLEDLNALLASGDLELTPAADIYGEGPSFDPEQQLAVLADVLDDALAHGYLGLRVVADSTPLVRGSDAELEHWLAWEQMADEFQADHPVLGICFFDRRQVPIERLRDLAAVHPVFSAIGDEPPFRIFWDDGVMRVTGSVDLFSAERLQRVLTGSPRREQIVIDLSDAEFLDHRAVEILGQRVDDGTVIEIRHARPVLRRVWDTFDPLPHALRFQ